MKNEVMDAAKKRSPLVFSWIPVRLKLDCNPTQGVASREFRAKPEGGPVARSSTCRAQGGRGGLSISPFGFGIIITPYLEKRRRIPFILKKAVKTSFFILPDKKKGASFKLDKQRESCQQAWMKVKKLAEWVREHISLNKSRAKCLMIMMKGMIALRTVNLSRLIPSFDASVKGASHERRMTVSGIVRKNEA